LVVQPCESPTVYVVAEARAVEPAMTSATRRSKELAMVILVLAYLV